MIFLLYLISILTFFTTPPHKQPLTNFPPPTISQTVLGQKKHLIQPKKRIQPTPPIYLTSTPTPSPTYALHPTTIPTSASANPILDAINTYRTSHGLQKVSESEATCAFAKTRAEELATEFSHKKFRERIDSHTLPYPTYHEITENIAQNPNPEDVVPQWIASEGHATNMRKNTPFVCVRSFGQYYAYEGHRP